MFTGVWFVSFRDPNLCRNQAALRHHKAKGIKILMLYANQGYNHNFRHGKSFFQTPQKCKMMSNSTVETSYPWQNRAVLIKNNLFYIHKDPTNTLKIND